MVANRFGIEGKDDFSKANAAQMGGVSNVPARRSQ
jgi:hypothetical protein